MSPRRTSPRANEDPEGPALVAAEEVVQVSTVPPVSEATLLLRTDASGKVVYAELLRVDAAADEWERVKRDLLDRLASVRLRVPASSGGVTMKMKTSSDNQLPSGAHPGLAINMLGILIKEGEGPRSTRVDILTPKIIVQAVFGIRSQGTSKRLQLGGDDVAATPVFERRMGCACEVR